MAGLACAFLILSIAPLSRLGSWSSCLVNLLAISRIGVHSASQAVLIFKNRGGLVSSFPSPVYFSPGTTPCLRMVVAVDRGDRQEVPNGPDYHSLINGRDGLELLHHAISFFELVWVARLPGRPTTEVRHLPSLSIASSFDSLKPVTSNIATAKAEFLAHQPFHQLLSKYHFSRTA